ncbi:MAG: epoxyqueuosine reductase QueH [Brevinema sp.]
MKTLMLHTCCAPCVTACIDVLKGLQPWEKILAEKPDFTHFIVYFYNPNIHPKAEYLKRAAEAERYASEVGAEFVMGAYDEPLWTNNTKGLENEPEKGARCAVCYDMRLAEAFRLAQERGCAAVATSLTLSPFKNTVKINEIGTRLAQETGMSYLHSDFKKNNGFARSKEMSRASCIYCQNYCGCRFSLRDKLLRTQAE